MKPERWNPFASAFAISCALACSDQSEPAAELSNSSASPNSPNILLVVLDDVGVDMVGAYGADPAVARTPNIDALAKRGLMFKNAWATPLCTPTRAAIQTGRYGFRTGIGTVGTGGLSLEELTLPEMLRLGTDGAYATAAIGKWHLGNNGAGSAKAPNEAGYDHFSGTLGNLSDYFKFKKVIDGETVDARGYATSDQVNDALAWLEKAPEPWFCYLAFNSAHRPLHNPPPRLVKTKQHDPDPGRAAFSAMVEALDTELGRLFEGIPAEAFARTNLILLSDNGTHRAQSAEPVKASEGKGSVHESGIAVPFMIAGPDVRLPGRSVDAVVDITDIFATVAEWAEVDLASLETQLAGPLDSVSLAPYLAEPDRAPLRATAFSECFRPNGFGPYSLIRRAIRDERFKLVHLEKTGRPNTDHLYDLRTDPGEERDLLKQETLTAEQDDAFERLNSRMKQLLEP